MLQKYEIAAVIGRRLGLRSYLEIVTPTTGRKFDCVDATQFPDRSRAVYYCPSDWSDGAAINYRTDGDGSDLSFADRKFDLVFVDSWHEYTNSRDDIALALRLVAPKGVVLLHDCNPESAEKARPKLPEECVKGQCDRQWNGETYAALIDRFLGANDADYVTIDDDHGCGMILPGRKIEGPRPSASLISRWKDLKHSSERFAFFDIHRADLLRLRSPQWLLETWSPS